MKTLIETVQQSIVESIEGELQTITTSLKDKADNDGMIMFKKPVEIGENDACIEGININGDMLMLTVSRNSDAVSIRFFSSETLREVLDAVRKLK